MEIDSLPPNEISTNQNVIANLIRRSLNKNYLEYSNSFPAYFPCHHPGVTTLNPMAIHCEPHGSLTRTLILILFI